MSSNQSSNSVTPTFKHSLQVSPRHNQLPTCRIGPPTSRSQTEAPVQPHKELAGQRQPPALTRHRCAPEVLKEEARSPPKLTTSSPLPHQCSDRELCGQAAAPHRPAPPQTERTPSHEGLHLLRSRGQIRAHVRLVSTVPIQRRMEGPAKRTSEPARLQNSRAVTGSMLCLHTAIRAGGPANSWRRAHPAVCERDLK